MSLIATCHCGHTAIELPHLPAQAKECNCSYCSRTGAVWGYFQPAELKILSNVDDRTYSASSNGNVHHFCGNCGMQTFGASPDWASLYNNDGTPKNGDPTAVPTTFIYAVNLRLIDGFDFSSVDVEMVDGRNNW